MDHFQKAKKEYIFQNKLGKACFQHDMAYGDFKDLTKRTASDKILPNKAIDIAKNLKYDGYQKGLASMDYKFFDKKTSATRANKFASRSMKNGNISHKELAEELHKPIIRIFKKRKVHSPFVDNICGTDLADMQLISKFNKGFRYLLCAIVIYSKSTWVIPLEDKKRITITNAFQKILKESNRKPNEILVGKGSEFYNRSMKSWL